VVVALADVADAVVHRVYIFANPDKLGGVTPRPTTLVGLPVPPGPPVTDTRPEPGSSDGVED